jgi:hypothetical protein
MGSPASFFADVLTNRHVPTMSLKAHSQFRLRVFQRFAPSWRRMPAIHVLVDAQPGKAGHDGVE